MMFDPPDYPYKELSEYDNLLENKNVCSDVPDAVDETIINETSNNLSFQSNNSGRYFSNVDSTFYQLNCVTQNITYATSNETLLNYEPTLLDENTVNQFLLPLQETTPKPETDSTGPDLLALHSCAICHEIFTSESDLLDHTIAFHASLNIESQCNDESTFETPPKHWEEQSNNNNNANLEAEWLICRICQRVLSTVLETEPTEQLCCTDLNGACNVSAKKLATMFVCEGCSGLFADGEALDKHRMSCYVEDANFYEVPKTINYDEIIVPQPELCFKCDFCGIQCMSVDELKFHLMECKRHVRGRRNRTYTPASSSKMWNCGSCNQLFITARELYRHKRGEDRPEGAPMTAYVCDECDKVLGSMCALHTHKKMHRTTKPGYPCKICGRRFNQSGHLAIHMRMHTGERPYPCDLCSKAFKVKVERDDHRRTHTGERPFACAECPKTFTAAARLREHARIHTDQRPYRCDICGAAFRRPYARTVHTLIHTGEKPHECDVCGTAFRRSGDMWKHKRTLHGA